MSDLRKKGVHAVSFNSLSIGLEVLGNYDIENPTSGRGLNCWITAASATKALLDWLNLSATPDTILFHRDDPATTKSCPGKAVTKDWFIDLVNKSSGAVILDVTKPVFLCFY